MSFKFEELRGSLPKVIPTRVRSTAELYAHLKGTKGAVDNNFWFDVFHHYKKMEDPSQQLAALLSVCRRIKELDKDRKLGAWVPEMVDVLIEKLAQPPRRRAAGSMSTGPRARRGARLPMPGEEGFDADEFTAMEKLFAYCLDVMILLLIVCNHELLLDLVDRGLGALLKFVTFGGTAFIGKDNPSDFFERAWKFIYSTFMQEDRWELMRDKCGNAYDFLFNVIHVWISGTAISQAGGLTIPPPAVDCRELTTTLYAVYENLIIWCATVTTTVVSVTGTYLWSSWGREDPAVGERVILFGLQIPQVAHLGSKMLSRALFSRMRKRPRAPPPPSSWRTWLAQQGANNAMAAQNPFAVCDGDDSDSD